MPVDELLTYASVVVGVVIACLIIVYAMRRRRIGIDERYLIYGMLVVIPIATAIITAFVGLAVLGYSLAIISGLLCVILGFVAEIYVTTVVRKRPPVKIIFGEAELKKAYEKLRGDKTCTTVKAIWCTQYPDTSEYFEKERLDLAKNPRLDIKRLIHSKRVGEKDYLEHLEASKDLLKSPEGKYRIKLTDVKEFECLLCAYTKHGERVTKALLVFNDVEEKRPGLGILLDPTKDKRISFAVMATDFWFDAQWNAVEEINIS